jgi:hypothetical protein
MIFKRLLVCVSAILLLLLPGHSQSIPSLDEILKRVGENLQVFKDTLPDFECREIVKQRWTFTNGQPPLEQTFASIIRVLQSPQQKGFNEQREYISINGRQIAQGEKAPEGLSNFYGGFSNLIFMAFAPNNQKFHDYKILGTETIQNRHALALAFNTIKGQKEIFMIFPQGKKIACRNTGTAWLDFDSMQVIRFKSQALNVPGGWSPMPFAADYGKFDIAGKEFWMPKSVQFSITERHGHWSFESIAEYSDYRKFEVSTKIKYAPDVQQ